MSVAISWAKKVQLAKCDISVNFPKSSHKCYPQIDTVAFVYLYLSDTRAKLYHIVIELFSKQKIS